MCGVSVQLIYQLEILYPEMRRVFIIIIIIIIVFYRAPLCCAVLCFPNFTVIVIGNATTQDPHTAYSKRDVNHGCPGFQMTEQWDPSFGTYESANASLLHTNLFRGVGCKRSCMVIFIADAVGTSHAVW